VSISILSFQITFYNLYRSWMDSTFSFTRSTFVPARKLLAPDCDSWEERDYFLAFSIALGAIKVHRETSVSLPMHFGYFLHRYRENRQFLMSLSWTWHEAGRMNGVKPPYDLENSLVTLVSFFRGFQAAVDRTVGYFSAVIWRILPRSPKASSPNFWSLELGEANHQCEEDQ
jgi:hypothetical protein